MNNIVHVVGGGLNQIPLINKAKEMGYKVLVTDMYENPPAKKYADFFAQINTTDIDNTLLTSIEYNICAILTDGTDVAVPTVSYISDKLNLQGIPFDIAIKCTNKMEMRNSLLAYKSNMPIYTYFNSYSNAKLFLLNNKKNVIIKPVDSQGSKGVYLLDSFDEVKLKTTFSESKSGILIEEYIEGPQFSVEALIENGVVHLLLITRIEFYENKNIAKRLIYFNDIASNIAYRLEELNKNIIHELKLNDCVTHAEYKIREGIPYLIEIACRGGGANISTIAIPYLTNINIQEFILSKALKLKYKFEKVFNSELMIIEFLDFKYGQINGFKIDKRIDEIVYCYEVCDIKVINEINSSRDRYGFLIVTGQTKDEIECKIKKAYKYIKPQYRNKLCKKS